MSTLSDQGGGLTPENPWPGLASYEEADSGFFFGRDREADALEALVVRERLTVVFGVSGLGKTSLLQAGLFPRLRRRNILPVRIRLDYSLNAPDFSRQIIEAVASQAGQRRVEAPRARRGDTLWEYFHRREADFWSERNQTVTPLIVLDQFEEVFTLGKGLLSGPGAENTFLADLADLIEGRPSQVVAERLNAMPDEAREFDFRQHRYKILLSLREDYLADLESLREDVRDIALNRLRVLPMNGEDALMVVQSAGANLIEPDVATKVVRFVAGVDFSAQYSLRELEIEPALLSLLCSELNHERRLQLEERCLLDKNNAANLRRDSRITATLLEGTRDAILSRFYEQSVDALAPDTRRFIEEELVTASGHRDSVALERALSEPGVDQRVLRKLEDSRLLRIEDRRGVKRVELTHDLLTGPVRASRDKRRASEAEQLARLNESQTSDGHQGTRKCYVTMGFGRKTDYATGRSLDLDATYEHVIRPAVEEAGLECQRADEMASFGGNLRVFQALLQAELVIADLSTSNANALYELGIRHALRPSATIVVAESGFQIPSALNFIQVLTYKHLGEDLGHHEALRFRAVLVEQIRQFFEHQQVDSPVYAFLGGLRPPELSPTLENEQPTRRQIDVSVGERVRALKGVFADARKAGDWEQARAVLVKLRELAPRDEYVVQQLALATYKSCVPDERSALLEALEILGDLHPTTSNDPETIGLWGTIHARLWENNRERAYLDEAIRTHERGFALSRNYDSGTVVAYLFNVRASLSEDDDEIADTVLAERVRRTVIQICRETLANRASAEGTGDRNDTFWVQAALVECLLGVGEVEESNMLLKALEHETPEAWMVETLVKRLEKLTPLLRKRGRRHRSKRPRRH